MHESGEVEKRLREEAERISDRYQGAPVVVIVGGSREAGLPRTMIASSLHDAEKAILRLTSVTRSSTPSTSRSCIQTL